MGPLNRFRRKCSSFAPRVPHRSPPPYCGARLLASHPTMLVCSYPTCVLLSPTAHFASPPRLFKPEHSVREPIVLFQARLLASRFHRVVLSQSARFAAPLCCFKHGPSPHTLSGPAVHVPSQPCSFDPECLICAPLCYFKPVLPPLRPHRVTYSPSAYAVPPPCHFEPD